MMLARPSAIALVLANLVPLAGVYWLDWRVFDVLMLYWAENVVIGAVNVLRMLACRTDARIDRTVPAGSTAKLAPVPRAAIRGVSAGFRFFLIPFFIVHYGMFCFGHYIAVVSLFGSEQGGPLDRIFDTPISELWQSPFWAGVVAIAISHLLSFYFNFLGNGEYRHTSQRELMRRPYGRIVVLHVSVIAGGLLVSVLGDPRWMLVVLIGIKTAIDLHMHEKERMMFDGRATGIAG